MNKRQREKHAKKYGRAVGMDFLHCESCGKKLNVRKAYHNQYHVCDMFCFADNVGVNLYEF